jgi:hypothetical protein
MKYLKLFEDKYDDANVRKRILAQMKKNAHRKDMRNFEKMPAIQFEDDYLKVHKIKEGPNNGKILLKFNDDRDMNTTWSVLSMTSGCAKILDTKYEKIPEIRKVELSNFRVVHSNSIDVILENFLKQMGYEDNNILWYKSEVMVKLKELFADKIKMCVNSAKDLGEVMDNLRKVREEIFEFQKPHYEEWEMRKNANKYNL